MLGLFNPAHTLISRSFRLCSQFVLPYDLGGFLSNPSPSSFIKQQQGVVAEWLTRETRSSTFLGALVDISFLRERQFESGPRRCVDISFCFFDNFRPPNDQCVELACISSVLSLRERQADVVDHIFLIF